MRAVCVDDENLVMKNTVLMLKRTGRFKEIKGFTKAGEALAFLDKNPADVALLDINMPDMNGIELAKRIKIKWPRTSIIFLTCHPEYAVEAFSVRASGYLVKPVSNERLKADVDYVLTGKKESLSGRIVVRTFGNFDIFVDGKAMDFKMAKCKELLAYLIDKRGTGASRAELSSVLWEDRIYDRKTQKLLDTYIRSMRATLRENDAEEIFEMHKGILRVLPDHFVCDAYRLFSGDADAINSFKGEYMGSYSWASVTEGMMFWNVADKTYQQKSKP